MATSLSASRTRLVERWVHALSTLPPLTLVPGHSPSHEQSAWMIESAVAEVVAALLRRSRRAVAVDDRKVEEHARSSLYTVPERIRSMLQLTRLHRENRSCRPRPFAREARTQVTTVLCNSRLPPRWPYSRYLWGKADRPLHRLMIPIIGDDPPDVVGRSRKR
jgi:hypothetical protein